MSQLESLAQKKLRSFALFPAKKKAKYESAYGLFGEAANAYLEKRDFTNAGNCLRHQAKLCINKLQKPVESAKHYMEATRSFVLAESFDEAFECLQLALSARTKPQLKHKDKTDLEVQGITVTEGALVVAKPAGDDGNAESPDVIAAASWKKGASPLVMPKATAVTRSPALTSQAGTIGLSLDGKSLYLSPETMQAPISSSASRSATITPRPNGNLAAPSLSTLFDNPSSSAATGSSPARPPSSSTSATPPIPRQRRHSLSGSANSSNVTAEGVVHEVLHLDLLLARLAVQLATDLWTDLAFRDAILSLEIASSLFATLLIAERNVGTFKTPKGALPPYLPPVDPPFARAESASTQNSPNSAAKKQALSVKDTSTLAIEERLAGLLGPNAHSMHASSMTLGSFTLSSRPITAKPLPSFVFSENSDAKQDAKALVLHTTDPHLGVAEGEGYLLGSGNFNPGISILEESLVCRFQLGKYYVTFDQELGDNERSSENQELRRSKALFEQIASSKPDEALTHAHVIPVLTEVLGIHNSTSSLAALSSFSSSASSVECPNTSVVNSPHAIDEVANLICQYAADDDKLHSCLFIAGLCDALIGVRVYQASQQPNEPPPSTPAPKPAGKASSSNSKPKTPIAPPHPVKPWFPPPPVPELYRQARTVNCPPILLRYREMSASFGLTPEIRFLRSCNGLLQMAANLPQRLNDAFGGTAPRAAKQLFQAAWGQAVLQEFTEVVNVYARQKPLTSIVSKLLVQIKKEMKSTIQG